MSAIGKSGQLAVSGELNAVTVAVSSKEVEKH
jgi:hypothetical protein